MSTQNKYIIYLSVKVEIETSQPLEQAIDDFYANTNYNFSSTDVTSVINTELLNVESVPPMGL